MNMSVTEINFLESDSKICSSHLSIITWLNLIKFQIERRGRMEQTLHNIFMSFVFWFILLSFDKVV